MKNRILNKTVLIALFTCLSFAQVWAGEPDKQGSFGEQQVPASTTTAEGVARLNENRMSKVVKVHLNSQDMEGTLRLAAKAFAEGTEIQISPGPERHLPHEAWHVVQRDVTAIAQMASASQEVTPDTRELRDRLTPNLVGLFTAWRNLEDIDALEENGETETQAREFLKAHIQEAIERGHGITAKEPPSAEALADMQKMLASKEVTALRVNLYSNKSIEFKDAPDDEDKKDEREEPGKR